MPRTLSYPDRSRPAAALPPEFGCTLRDGGLDVAWVRVAGELDVATAPQLKQVLGHAEDRARRVVLDLRELTFMDTSGMHVVVAARVRATSAGRQLVVVRGPSQVDRLLALTGARDRLEIVDLNPAEPPAQALVQLARRERAKESRRCDGGLIDTAPDAPARRSQAQRREPSAGASLPHGSAGGLS